MTNNRRSSHPIEGDMTPILTGGGSRRGEVALMPKTLWQLRGSTNKVIECHVDRTAFGLHAITVVLGQEALLSETYPDETSARSRAMQVRYWLLKSGTWTLVYPAPGPSSRRRIIGAAHLRWKEIRNRVFSVWLRFGLGRGSAASGAKCC